MRDELDQEFTQHDPRTPEGLAHWQQQTVEEFLLLTGAASPLAQGIIEGQRTFADLNAEETALFLGLLANLGNLIHLFILYPRQHLQELLAEVTPQYTADENLEA
jgi:hypothetical protein